MMSTLLRDPNATTIEPGEFTEAFRHHAAGVAVVTADAGLGPVGLTATSVASVSIDPPVLIFSLSSRSSSSPAIARSETVVVHLLGADQLSIAKLCATSGIDRFADDPTWGRLDTGEPYFPAARSWVRGRIVERMAAGGSTVVAVQALDSGGSGAAASAPLVYHDRTWHRLDQGSAIAS